MPTTTGKVILIVLDGLGIGELPDAGEYGDRGSNTLANTAHAVGGLHLPRLTEFGLGNVVAVRGIAPTGRPTASYGRMAQVSRGKDSTTGHWELAGLIVERPFPTYKPGFPPHLMETFLRETGCAGYLGNTTASGTAIIAELGDEHLRTGYPIVYTSADSVLQIAAHESVIPLQRLYEICRTTRESVCVGPDAVSRVIARPFVGVSGAYSRTGNRRDFSLDPPGHTILDLLAEKGVPTIGIGKIDDLFARRGLAEMHHTRTNAEGLEKLLETARSIDRGLVMVNLGDFDALYGHRNDPAGFANALEEFDRRLPEIAETLDEGDVLFITADHGNDPTTPGTDHSREYVPLLCHLPGCAGVDLGTRETFADVGKTIGELFGVGATLAGTSFVQQIRMS